MDSDDDYQSFSPPTEPSSPSLHLPKLKRLKKKSTRASTDAPPSRSVHDDLIPVASVDFAKLEALESSKTLASNDSEEQSQSQSSSEGFTELIPLPSVDFAKLEALESSKTLVSNDSEEQLQSESPPEGFENDDMDLGEKIVDLGMWKMKKRRSGEGRSGDKKDRKKRGKSVLPTSPVDFAKLEASESSKTLGFDADLYEPVQSQSPADNGFDSEMEPNSGGLGGDRRETRRALEFEEGDDEFGGDRGDHKEQGVAETRVDKSEKKQSSQGGLNGKKEKNKRAKSGVHPSNKRREEKENSANRKQLHAETQRLLRETRGAGFKPVPVVAKPISSILEKIRQRKLEVSKKISLLNNSVSISESNDSVREVMINTESEKVSAQGGTFDKLANRFQEEPKAVAGHDDLESNLNASSIEGVKESRTLSSHENVKSLMALEEESTPAFRAAVDDTQDLFGDSQTSDSNAQPKDQQSSPLEEVLAPSLLAMNLKFDSAPHNDDISSSEEDNDKENIDPLPHKPDNACSSPKGDPVKAFVDDEAEEEDDSDNDLLRFQENEEDEGNEDSDDLNDLIVTGYKEKPIDKDRRNELHQKWLEQQDAAGTDNLMQRLKCGPKIKDTTLLDVEDENDEDEDEDEPDEDKEDLIPAITARMNTRKAKQMITQMFNNDKDDAFLSSDDEETEKRLVKQRLLDKAGDQATLVSPAEDESSREVFGLIKKLNNEPVTKKKTKVSSFFDTMLTTGGNSKSSSKSSFLGRGGSYHSLPASNKQRSSMVRSFIFGRDDSNSRSSISISEDSSDAVSRENRPARNVTVKSSGSQVKSITQCTKIAAETSSGTSLFEILRHSSMQSTSCNQEDSMVGLTETVFSAFKIPKNSIKVEGRAKH